MKIIRYTINEIEDVLDFERNLRKEEDFWGWEIDEDYIQSVKDSFIRKEFDSSISLLVSGRCVRSFLLSLTWANANRVKSS